MKKMLKGMLVAAVVLMFSLLSTEASQAKTVQLDKIGATVNLQDDWTLVDTDMSDEEIMELLDVSKEVVERVRQQWNNAGEATIEYDVTNMQQNADIIINTVPAPDGAVQEANDFTDEQRTQVQENIVSGLENQGAVISDFETLSLGDSFCWRFHMIMNGQEAYEYQTLHEGKYITFSVNSVDTALDAEKKNFLINFMNGVRFNDLDREDSLYDAEDSGEESIDVTPQTELETEEDKEDDKQTKLLTVLIIWGLVGLVTLLVIAGVIVLVVVLVKRSNKQNKQDNE